MYLRSIFILFFSFVFSSSAQSEWYAGQVVFDSVYSEKIKSCLLSPTGSLIDFPAVEIHSSEKLRLQFDDFDDDVQDYIYTINHCNADWTISELHSSEFVDGFSENYIDNYAFSFNTKRPYVHYELVLPNQDFKFVKSGNYVLTAYDSEHRNHPIFTKRFMVYEKSVLVGVDVHQATLAKGRYTDHEVDVTVNFTQVDYVNPIQDVKVSIYQGHRWDNVITNLKPSFIEGKRLVYDFEEESSFKAGNEYRFFDTKSVRFYGEGIQRVIPDSVDIFLLYPDFPRANKPYSFYPDWDGYYVPNIMERANANVEADYVWVNFCLKQNPFITKGEVYVFGGLTNWNLRNDAKMVYSEQESCYETSLMLKQGYYNYTYLFVEEGEVEARQDIVDGSFYQSSQDYFVFVYLYDHDYGYDRLVGTRKVTTQGMF